MNPTKSNSQQNEERKYFLWKVGELIPDENSLKVCFTSEQDERSGVVWQFPFQTEETHFERAENCEEETHFGFLIKC